MRPEDQTNEQSPVTTSDKLTLIAQFRRQVMGLMRVDDYEILQDAEGAIAFRGQLLEDPETAFPKIEQRFARLGYTPILRDWSDDGHEIIIIKEVEERAPGRLWVNAALFLATMFSVLYIGAANALQEADMFIDPESLDALMMPLTHLHWGIPFAATLMSILLAHELSHYFVARRYGSPVSLPYFIPMPLSLMGTMGAVIVQRAPMRDRKALFDIGVAGPLGGLIVAIPLVILGLSLSNVQAPPPNVDVVLQEGNSLLYLGLKYLVFGQILPSGGVDVWLHSVAFAAWAGLLVTMINLIPVGQLDGGHISYALLGKRANVLSRIAIIAMFGWGGWLLLNGNNAGGFWITWGGLNIFFNNHHPPPLNDALKLDRKRVALGIGMLVIFILLFMPAPLQQVYLR
jgi:membrane-associated protease RseP (regulator of RpoE activity)